MASDPLQHHYGCLTAPERFALTLETMARGDEAEADKLEDACPRLTYTHADSEFRDRPPVATDRRSSSMRASLFRADRNQLTPLPNRMLTARERMATLDHTEVLDEALV